MYAFLHFPVGEGVVLLSKVLGVEDDKNDAVLLISDLVWFIDDIVHWRSNTLLPLIYYYCCCF